MKQQNIPWLGAVVDSLYTSLPVLSIINFVAITTVLYTNIHPYLQEHLPWMRFWIFIVFMVVATLILIVVVYKFVVPSLWAFRSKQMFTHESEVTNKLDKLIKKVEELEEKTK